MTELHIWISIQETAFEHGIFGMFHFPTEILKSGKYIGVRRKFGKQSLCYMEYLVAITGNGLKDPSWALDGAPKPATIAPDVTSAATALGLA